MSDSLDALKLRRIRLLNELSFITGDRARGGPPREVEAAGLRTQLAEIDAEIRAAGPASAPHHHQESLR